MPGATQRCGGSLDVARARCAAERQARSQRYRQTFRAVVGARRSDAEVRAAEALMRQEGVPYIDTTRKSIEEIAATILHDTRLVRHVY